MDGEQGDMMNTELLPSLGQRDLDGQMAVPMHARMGRLVWLVWRRITEAEFLVAVDDALDSVSSKATNARWDRYVF
jgi:hypothetical protein